MSLLKCNYCGQEVESGLKNILDHMDVCAEAKTVEKLSELFTAIYTKGSSLTIIKSDINETVWKQNTQK